MKNSMYGTDKVQIEHILLQKIQFKFEQEISRMDLNFIYNLDMYAKHISDSFIYQLKMNILGERFKEKIFCPKNWFEHFKKQCFPKWLLKKFPVKEQELTTLEIYQLYPHIKGSIPQERHYIHYQTFDLLKNKSYEL